MEPTYLNKTASSVSLKKHLSCPMLVDRVFLHSGLFSAVNAFLSWLSPFISCIAALVHVLVFTFHHCLHFMYFLFQTEEKTVLSATFNSLSTPPQNYLTIFLHVDQNPNNTPFYFVAKTTLNVVQVLFAIAQISLYTYCVSFSKFQLFYVVTVTHLSISVLSFLAHFLISPKKDEKYSISTRTLIKMTADKLKLTERTNTQAEIFVTESYYNREVFPYYNSITPKADNHYILVVDLLGPSIVIPEKVDGLSVNTRLLKVVRGVSNQKNIFTEKTIVTSPAAQLILYGHQVAVITSKGKETPDEKTLDELSTLIMGVVENISENTA